MASPSRAPLDLPRTPPLRLRGRTFDASSPAVMGIINRTSDSFFADNRHADLDSAKRALDDAVARGADIVDIGGVRAGQEGETVDAQQEIDRVIPFVAHARETYPDLVLSLDTWRSEVAAEAGRHGLDLVNDTWAGHDPELVHVAARIGAGVVCSHTGGLPPRTDPVKVTYGPDPLDVVRRRPPHAGRRCSAGRGGRHTRRSHPDRPDPRLRQDHGPLARGAAAHGRVAELGYPILQALSRKDFVGESLDLEADDRLEGTLASTAIAAWLGATVFRAHDVRATRRVVDMVAVIRGDRSPVRAVRGV